MYVLIHRFKQNYVGLTIEVIFVNIALTHHETLLDRLNLIKQSGRYSLGEGYQSDQKLSHHYQHSKNQLNP